MALSEAIEVNAASLLSQRGCLLRRVPEPVTAITDLNTPLEQDARSNRQCFEEKRGATDDILRSSAHWMFEFLHGDRRR